MTVLVISILHALAVYIIGTWTKSRARLNTVAIGVAVIGVITGNPMFMLADLIGVAIGYYLGKNYLDSLDKRYANSRAKPQPIESPTTCAEPVERRVTRVCMTDDNWRFDLESDSAGDDDSKPRRQPPPPPPPPSPPPPQAAKATTARSALAENSLPKNHELDLKEIAHDASLSIRTQIVHARSKADQIYKSKDLYAAGYVFGFLTAWPGRLGVKLDEIKEIEYLAICYDRIFGGGDMGSHQALQSAFGWISKPDFELGVEQGGIEALRTSKRPQGLIDHLTNR